MNISMKHSDILCTSFLSLQNGHFVPVVAVSKFDVRPHHHCVTKRDVSIHSLDEYGEDSNGHVISMQE